MLHLASGRRKVLGRRLMHMQKRSNLRGRRGVCKCSHNAQECTAALPAWSQGCRRTREAVSCSGSRSYSLRGQKHGWPPGGSGRQKHSGCTARACRPLHERRADRTTREVTARLCGCVSKCQQRSWYAWSAGPRTLRAVAAGLDWNTEQACGGGCVGPGVEGLRGTGGGASGSGLVARLWAGRKERGRPCKQVRSWCNAVGAT
jgi:hypothetical protein